MCGGDGAQSRGPTPPRAAVVPCPPGLAQRSRRSCDLLSPVPKWMRAGGGQEVMQDASRLGQAANLAEHRRRQGARDASKLAPVEGSQTAPGAQAEERAQGTAWSMVRLASAPVGRKRAHRKPLIDPGKRVRKACRKRHYRMDAVRRLVQEARKHIEYLLIKAGPETAVSASRAAIEREIEKLAATATVPQDQEREGRHFFEARRDAAQGAIAPIRAVGGQMIHVRDLRDQEVEEIERGWHAEWKTAAASARDGDGQEAWRFGGSLYWLGSPL